MTTGTTGTTATPLLLCSRIAAAVVGGWAFTWGFIALGMASLFAAGMEFHDGEHLSNILGIALFLVMFLWAFSARSLRRVWLVLAGGGAAMAAAASLVQALLL